MAIVEAPLDVIIVGAGIGGLATALGLLQAGHKVRIFEKSKFANEVGAALTLDSNLTSPFAKLSFNPEKHGANKEEHRVFYTQDGHLMFAKELSTKNSRLMHRVDLHDALRQAAIDAGADIRLSTQLASTDPDAGSITLQNNQTFKADLIIGADGIHSTLRPFIVPNAPSPTPFRISTYRMLIPNSTLLTIPETASFLSPPGKMTVYTATDGRRIVAYPCRSNTIMNVVALFPASLSKSFCTAEERKTHMMQLFTDFDATPQALIAACQDPALWTLYDLPALETWYSGKAILIGDAAHPTLPFAAQGGAQAIEDAVTLAVLFGKGTGTEDVQEKFKLFFDIRYMRARWIQEFARGADQSIPETPGVKSLEDPVEFFEKVQCYDVCAVAAERLGEYLERLK